jgi:hypothetical protein
MLVSSCSDPRSAATSEHNAAESDGDGAAVLADGLPADGLPDALPLELQAAASNTRTARRTARQARRISVTLLILGERAVRRPASPHTRRVIPQMARCAVTAHPDHAAGNARVVLSHFVRSGHRKVDCRRSTALNLGQAGVIFPLLPSITRHR